ncbi:MAG: FHA domain-containing protein [Bdellovibrionales bacterium]
MWGVKILSGDLVGTFLPLKPGRNLVGRAPHCNIIIPSKNVSKEHATIEVYGDKIIVTDLGSRNGTFVNGVQIKSHTLLPGQHIAMYDIIFEIVEQKKSSEKTKPGSDHKLKSVGIAKQPSHARPIPNFDGNVAYNQNHQMPEHLHSVPDINNNLIVAQNSQLSPHLNSDSHTPPNAETVPSKNLWAYFLKYLDEVVLPGVYKIAVWTEFKIALGIFVAIFILFVTLLSTVPLMRILKSSIEKEAQNRTQTIARSLVRDNRTYVMQGQNTLISVENAEKESGVKAAYIISSNQGEIIAPVRLAGQYISDIPFVNEARKTNQETVNQVDSSTIVAVAPIRYYNPNTGSESVSAYAVVQYNMGALAVDDGRTLSLFVQVLFIAIILGGILFFFLYKTILHPITDLNNQLDNALRDGTTQVQTVYRFPELQQLATNINSSISRGHGGFAGDNLQQAEPDRNGELQNIIGLIGFPALVISANDKVIVAVNDHFLAQIGQSGNWVNIPIHQILDQALKLNLQALTDRVISDPSQIGTDHLEILNQSFSLSAVGINALKSLACILVVFIPRATE